MPSVRHICRILKRVCNEQGIEYSSDSSGWVLTLTKGKTRRRVVGYDFDINSAASNRLALDKSALADALLNDGIPAVPHRLVIHPTLQQHVSPSGNWWDISQVAENFGWDVVVKPNEGTGGRDVHRARTPRELEVVIQELFLRNNTIALSPYIDAAREHRCIVLGDRVLLSYEKIRPSVVGDGQRTLLELITNTDLEQKLERGAQGRMARVFRAIDPEIFPLLHEVFPSGKEVVLNWRHNLAQGSIPHVVEMPALHELAIQGAYSSGLKFCSIDIITGGDSPTPKILEINGGVMMESFVELLPNGEELAHQVYSAAVEAMFSTS